MATQQLPPLQVAGDVRIQNQIGPNPHKWDKTGLVIKVKQFKQYLIRVDRSVRVTLRNLKFLRKFSCVRRQIILMGLSKNSFADVTFFGCQYQLQIRYIQSLTNGRNIKRNLTLKKDNFVKYSGTSLQRHHQHLKNMSALERCPVLEVLLKLALLLKIPAPKCIETAHPYSPVSLSLLSWYKSMDQRQCVIAAPYI